MATTTLTLSSDRKVSPAAHWETGAARWKPDVPNAFGLPSGVSCPGKTPFCDGCYALNTERMYTAVGTLVRRNLEALQAARTVPAMAQLLSDMLDTYRVGHAKAERKHGRTLPLTFRIHWDGDFYSVAYAKAWAQVIRANPDITFWAYTRSFVGRVNVVPVLAGIANLSLYLSADVHNGAAARRVADAHPGVRLAWCADTMADGATLAAVHGSNPGPACPENTRKIPLVSDDGRGACDTCGLCVHGRNEVRFSIRKGK